ncbi:hypothetical protein GGX14DRAFT_582817 [Mycena pura]|uniref:Uncharacterized protein n=1 Tax=Mycena pura TaxID=153505 RepID=A0AAD6YV23_9AGAR|nr:hypothetical protein GGX14DRAFT_582817 [Mycena pura]
MAPHTASPRAHPGILESLTSRPQLHSIVAVMVVLQQGPSPLQISHVLGISWRDVHQDLHTLPEEFFDSSSGPPEHYYSEVHLSHSVKNRLSDPSQCDSEFWVDTPKWHALLAKWCLRSNGRYNARDIFYANDFWAYHVCRSRPSEDLWDTLRQSPVPCRLTSHAALPAVIAWLEQVDVDDTRELSSMYKNCYRVRVSAAAAGERVRLMGLPIGAVAATINFHRLDRPYPGRKPPDAEQKALQTGVRYSDFLTMP